MHIEKKVEPVYLLWMSAEDKAWLQAVMQNPIVEVGMAENDAEREMREKFFRILSEAK